MQRYGTLVIDLTALHSGGIACALVGTTCGKWLKSLTPCFRDGADHAVTVAQTDSDDSKLNLLTITSIVPLSTSLL